MAHIEQVAGSFIEPLYKNEQFSLFRLDLPAGQTLPDHDTGPRLIVLLTPLQGRRLADNSEVQAEADQAIYLDNSFTGAMTNTGEDLAYLVLDLKQLSLQRRETQPAWHPSMHCLYRADQLAVWQLSEGLALPIPQPTLHYARFRNAVTLYQKADVCHCEAGDILFALVA